MKPRTKKAAVLLSLILLAILALGLFFITRDEAPPDDSDLLLPPRVEMAPAENSFVALDVLWSRIQIAPEFSDLEDEIETAELEGSGLSPELMARIQKELEAHGDWLPELDAALERPAYQSPEILDFSSRVTHIMPARETMRLLEMQARFDFAQGRERPAFDSGFRLLDVGHRMTRGAETIIEYLVGLAIVATGDHLIRDLLQRTSLGEDDLAEIQTVLGRHELEGAPLERVLKIEYRTMMQTFTVHLDAALGAASNPLTFKPHRTRRKAAEFFRVAVAIAGQDPAAAVSDLEALVPQPPAGWWENLRLILSGNAGGEMALLMAVPTLVKIPEKRWRMVADLRSTRVLVAVRRFDLARGRLPETLDELVPEFLEAVPLDPFDGQPLRYSKAAKVIYSVGTDFVDQGGSMDAESVDPLEPTVFIRF